jgi:GntR family transcriptional regulator/MocR family aminotransferase
MSLDLVLSDLQLPLAPGEARQQRLYRLLKTAILAGRLPAGLRLPGSRQLAADRRMARNGVLFAYQQLQAEGFLAADRGGTYVAALPLAAAGGASSGGPAAGFLSRRAAQLPAIDRGESPLPFAPGVVPQTTSCTKDSSTPCSAPASICLPAAA